MPTPAGRPHVPFPRGAMGLGRLAGWSSVDAEPDLERAAFGVVAPEDVGDVVGLMVCARGDAPTDRGVGDVDAAIGELVVEHPRVGDLGGERDPEPGTQRVGG